VDSGEAVTGCESDCTGSDAVADSELDTSGLGLIVGDSVTSWLRLDDSVGLGSGERLEGDSLTEALSLTVSD
jgi:hypothetical protein